MHWKVKKLCLWVPAGFFTLLAASVFYKTVIGFYGFKQGMATYIVPRESIFPMESFDLKAVSTGDAAMEHSITHAVRVTDTHLPYDLLRQNTGPDLRLYTLTDNPASVFDWIRKDPSAYEAVIKGFGDWKTFSSRYDSDLDLLEDLLGREMPSYLQLDSASMQVPVGFYLLPLFPPPRDYRQEYLMCAAKSMLCNAARPPLRAATDQYVFMIIRWPNVADILICDRQTGRLKQTVMVYTEEGILTDAQIADVCLALTEVRQM